MTSRLTGVPATVWRVGAAGAERVHDRLAPEEPLEIRVLSGAERLTTVTMRTLGADFELAAGFLHGEGVIASRDDIATISYCVDEADGGQHYNIVNVRLRAGAPAAPRTAPRTFPATSACGVCGTASLDALRIRSPSLATNTARMTAGTILGLPAALAEAQTQFQATGGVHAAGLFGLDGTLVALREDVGRHNAVDKVVGWALLQDQLPLSASAMLVSGRASYEILQKCLAAGVPIVCAVSAPSSLAVELAASFGMTLVGFLRAGRFNVYACPERILPEGARASDTTAL